MTKEKAWNLIKRIPEIPTAWTNNEKMREQNYKAAITSILEKMKRKNIPFEEMEEQVEDIAGIRIICQFVEDIQRVSDLHAGRSDMEI